jgi:hypothetical protein
LVTTCNAAATVPMIVGRSPQYYNGPRF